MRLIQPTEILKAMTRAGLTLREVDVKGRHGTYRAKRWFRTGEAPEQAKAKPGRTAWEDLLDKDNKDQLSARARAVLTEILGDMDKADEVLKKLPMAKLESLRPIYQRMAEGLHAINIAVEVEAGQAKYRKALEEFKAGLGGMVDRPAVDTKIKLAGELGAKAFHEGRSSASAQDPEFMKLMAGAPREEIMAMLTAFNTAWHREHQKTTDAEVARLGILPPKPTEGAEVGEPGKQAGPAKPPSVALVVKTGKKREFTDVGEHIGGSRKERWADIKAGKAIIGTGDLDDMDGADKKDLIHKKNLLPKDYIQRMRDVGVEPAPAFLIHKLFGTVDASPKDDTDAGRVNYVLAFDMLKKQLRHVKTMDDFKNAYREILRLADGLMLTPEERTVVDAFEAMDKARREETDRKWKEISKDPAYQTKKSRTRVAGRVIEMAGFDNQRASDDLWKHVAKWKEESGYTEKLRAKNEVTKNAQARTDNDPKSFRNLYKSLGKSFEKSMYGASAFNEHYREQRANPRTDWDWATKEAGGKAVREPIRKRPQWYREEKTETVERTGTDRDYKPQELLDEFGIRGVEYGNWMDEKSSAHHTKMLGLAFGDMARVLNIPVKDVSLKGRLAIAFGARGTGWAAAHYEPGRKVINLTKYIGGGSLAHEWFHFIDNIVKMTASNGTNQFSFMTGGKQGKLTTAHGATSSDMSGVHPDVVTAWAGLRSAMMDGGVRPYKSDPANQVYSRVGSVDRALEAGQSPQAIMDGFSSAKAFYGDKPRYSMRELKGMAAYIHQKSGTQVTYGPATSRFKMGSVAMGGDYWSDPIEMGARAFECYVHDKMAEAKARNTYLTKDSSADKSVERWASKNGEGYAPYPYGEERQTINKAFDRLFDALRADKTLEKARRRLLVVRRRQP